MAEVTQQPVLQPGSPELLNGEVTRWLGDRLLSLQHKHLETAKRWYIDTQVSKTATILSAAMVDFDGMKAKTLDAIKSIDQADNTPAIEVLSDRAAESQSDHDSLWSDHKKELVDKADRNIVANRIAVAEDQKDQVPADEAIILKWREKVYKSMEKDINQRALSGEEIRSEQKEELLRDPQRYQAAEDSLLQPYEGVYYQILDDIQEGKPSEPVDIDTYLALKVTAKYAKLRFDENHLKRETQWANLRTEQSDLNRMIAGLGGKPLSESDRIARAEQNDSDLVNTPPAQLAEVRLTKNGGNVEKTVRDICLEYRNLIEDKGAADEMMMETLKQEGVIVAEEEPNLKRAVQMMRELGKSLRTYLLKQEWNAFTLRDSFSSIKDNTLDEQLAHLQP